MNCFYAFACVFLPLKYSHGITYYNVNLFLGFVTFLFNKLRTKMST